MAKMRLIICGLPKMILKDADGITSYIHNKIQNCCLLPNLLLRKTIVNVNVGRSLFTEYSFYNTPG